MEIPPPITNITVVDDDEQNYLNDDDDNILSQQHDVKNSKNIIEPSAVTTTTTAQLNDNNNDSRRSPPRLYLLYGIIILQTVIFLSEMIIDQMVHSMLILADAYHHLFNSFNAILLVVCYKVFVFRIFFFRYSDHFFVFICFLDFQSNYSQEYIWLGTNRITWNVNNNHIHCGIDIFITH